MSPDKPYDNGGAATACIWVGPRDMIEEADPVACELLGYTRADLVGIHGSELVPLEDHASTAASLDRMRLGEVVRRNGHVLHSDGTVLAVEVTARILPDARLLLNLRRTTE